MPSTHWAYKRIEYAISQSVVQGYDDGLYHPEIAVTRDQMAVYIARAFDLAGWSLALASSWAGGSSIVVAVVPLRGGGSASHSTTQ